MGMERIARDTMPTDHTMHSSEEEATAHSQHRSLTIRQRTMLAAALPYVRQSIGFGRQLRHGATVARSGRGVSHRERGVTTGDQCRWKSTSCMVVGHPPRGQRRRQVTARWNHWWCRVSCSPLWRHSRGQLWRRRRAEGIEGRSRGATVR